MAVDASTPVGSSPVTGAIRKAAQATGTSFQYLLATAKVESDLNPNLTARTSTATGLFQFIEQTWLATLKQAGPAFGYGNYASAISRTTSGRYVVEDPGLRAEIMQLRKNPTANALMGGVFTQQNTTVLSKRLGRAPSEGELYIAHFFGPSGAAKAISLAQSNPNANAAEIFPAAASANRPIFYDKQGNARSISGVCAELARRYQVARAEQRAPVIAAAQKVAPPKDNVVAAVNQLALSPAAIPAALASEASSQRSNFFEVRAHSASEDARGRAGDTRPEPGSTARAALASEASSQRSNFFDVLAFERDANTPATAPATSQGASANAGRPMFHSLFQTGERREAIAPAISELWVGKTNDWKRETGE